MKALVVDDSFLMRTVLCGILAELGFETSTAKDGTDALDQLANGLQPDVMMLDLYMPNMTGLEVLGRVRGMPNLEAMRVVMVTGESDPGMKSWALQCGAHDYLTRPFNADTVADVLIRLDLFQEAEERLAVCR